jgi:hypothetical protein
MDDHCTNEHTFSRWKMVHEIYSSRTYAWIRRMVFFVSLHGKSDLDNIMSHYSDGVWFQEMMQLMFPNDIDSDFVARDLTIRLFVRL